MKAVVTHIKDQYTESEVHENCYATLEDNNLFVRDAANHKTRAIYADGIWRSVCIVD